MFLNMIFLLFRIEQQSEILESLVRTWNNSYDM